MTDASTQVNATAVGADDADAAPKRPEDVCELCWVLRIMTLESQAKGEPGGPLHVCAKRMAAHTLAALKASDAAAKVTAEAETFLANHLKMIEVADRDRCDLGIMQRNLVLEQARSAELQKRLDEAIRDKERAQTAEGEARRSMDHARAKWHEASMEVNALRDELAAERDRKSGRCGECGPAVQDTLQALADQRDEANARAAALRADRERDAVEIRRLKDQLAAKATEGPRRDEPAQSLPVDMIDLIHLAQRAEEWDQDALAADLYRAISAEIHRRAVEIDESSVDG